MTWLRLLQNWESNSTSGNRLTAKDHQLIKKDIGLVVTDEIPRLLWFKQVYNNNYFHILYFALYRQKFLR